MNPNLEIIEQFAYPILGLMAALPLLFLYAFNKSKEKPQPANNNFLTVYLILVGLIASVLVIAKAIELMPVASTERALFICSMLIIACIDQGLSLLPMKIKFQFDLSRLLLYSVILLCAIPLLWEISLHIIPSNISHNVTVMNTAQIILMTTIVILSFANGVIKKRKA